MNRHDLAFAARRLLASSVLSLPAPIVAKLGGEPITKDGFTLDPQIQLMLVLARASQVKNANEMPLRAARRELDASARVLSPEPPPRAHVESIEVDGAAGRLKARLYRPYGARAQGGAPCLLYFHGGGWVLGSLDSHDAPCRAFAEGAGCVVVSVDYRLAPEHPFPAAIDDATAAFRSIAKDAARYGIDPARIAVGGDSAGGNLAAVVCLDTRDDAVRPCFQLLVYPSTDMTLSKPSIETMARGFFLERVTIDWFLDQYVPDRAVRGSPRTSPLSAASHANLPPAFVVTAGFDPLRDEGRAYAKKLQDAGVACEEQCYGSLIHGFLHTWGTIRAARPPLEDMISQLRRAFAA
jgi:acetyl esterase